MSLFPESNKAALAQEMRDLRLAQVAATYFPAVTLSDDYIYESVLAAEAEASRRLRVFLEPVELVPQGTPAAVTDAYDDAEQRWEYEPNYDWRPDFFQGNQWGFIPTRQRPIIEIHSFKFAYASTGQLLYEFPISWVRADRKYGQIQIVPLGDFSSLPLNAWFLSVFSGGRSVPFMIQIAYRAGLEDAATNWPDVLSLIKRMATLKILEDMMLPSSGTISADGLSQSVTLDVQKMSEGIESHIETLRQAIHGIRMTVL